MQEEKDNFCNAVRAEVKQAGIIETPENCWDFFIQKARSEPVAEETTIYQSATVHDRTTKQCSTLSLEQNMLTLSLKHEACGVRAYL